MPVPATGAWMKSDIEVAATEENIQIIKNWCLKTYMYV